VDAVKEKKRFVVTVFSLKVIVVVSSLDALTQKLPEIKLT